MWEGKKTAFFPRCTRKTGLYPVGTFLLASCARAEAEHTPAKVCKPALPVFISAMLDGQRLICTFQFSVTTVEISLLLAGHRGLSGVSLV